MLFVRNHGVHARGVEVGAACAATSETIGAMAEAGRAAYYSGIILAYTPFLLFPKLFQNNPPRPSGHSFSVSHATWEATCLSDIMRYETYCKS